MLPLVLATAEAPTMTPGAWVIFVVVAGFLWGGFALLLLRAMRQEGRKAEAE